MVSLKKHVQSRLEGLRQDRSSFMTHWSEIARYILPRRYQWLVQPNKSGRGSAINNSIYDNTGTIALRVLSSGMMTGLTDPTRPWFDLRIEGYDTDTSNPVTLWLDEVKRRMAKVMQESNFYNSLATLYTDLGAFGTGAMLIYEDFEDVIRCYNACAGEYFLAVDDRFSVTVFYREFVLTVDQIVTWFGKANVSDTVRRAYDTGGASRQVEFVIGHAIEPNNDGVDSKVSRDFPYRSVYWEIGSREDQVLEAKGFWESPAITPRWDTVSNDAYGRSPAMDALGDIKQLQQETLRKSQAIDKMVNPPMIADVTLRNQPSSLLPGAVTYVAGLSATGAGMKPIYQFMPPVREIMMDIETIQARIRTAFFNDLFLMISQLDTVRSAAEINERRVEKLVQLGSVIERFTHEALDPIVLRVFNIMLRANLLPPPPQEIQGRPIEVKYVSMFAEAQRAASSTGIERWLVSLANLAAVDEGILDIADFYEVADELAQLLNVSPRLVRPREDYDAMQKRRAEMLQEQQAAQSAETLIKGADVLGRLPVGGGQVASEAMLSGGSLPGVRPI